MFFNIFNKEKSLSKYTYIEYTLVDIHYNKYTLIIESDSKSNIE